MGIAENQSQHRYSVEAVELLRKVLNGEEYSIYDENNNLVSPQSIEEKPQQLGMRI